MSFGTRLWDDGGFMPADHARRFPVVSSLLVHLGLFEAPKPDQVAGIRAWLRDHEASQDLVYSIEAHGYSDALDEFRASA